MNHSSNYRHRNYRYLQILQQALVNVESEAATQELLAIPGLLERIKQNQATPKTDYKNWRNIRSDERC